MTEGLFTRTACGVWLGEYKRTDGSNTVTLESRTEQGGDQWIQQRYLDEYVLDGGILEVSEHVGIEVTTPARAPIFWVSVASHYDFPQKLYAEKPIFGPYWLSTPYPFHPAFDVHVQ